MTKQEMLDTIKKQRSSLNDKITDSKIEAIISEAVEYIDRRWTSGWIELCDGKKILQRLIDTHISPRHKQLDISSFRSLIVSGMKRSSIYPQEIDNIIRMHVKQR